jgi:hypothetical protein
VEMGRDERRRPRPQGGWFGRRRARLLTMNGGRQRRRRQAAAAATRRTDPRVTGGRKGRDPFAPVLIRVNPICSTWQFQGRVGFENGSTRTLCKPSEHEVDTSGRLFCNQR